MSKLAIGFDVGGTKCAVVLGRFPDDGGAPEILGKRRFATAEHPDPYDCLETLCTFADELCNTATSATSANTPIGVGISCGGPLNPFTGVVQCPPNLPGWIDIPAVEFVSKRLGFPARLENDANACAYAEWKFGAGRGTRDMVFLTFGTGMGAGIIADGHLLEGRLGLAGEVGHLRLAPDGPVGFGKAGSFEGFCSGGGIGRQGQTLARAALDAGHPFEWCQTASDIAGITAKSIAEQAFAGDADARAIYASCGERLGQGLSLLIDILNPECIVIGSIFGRAEALLRPSMETVLRRECIPDSLAACRIVPAGLGESIGDVAALSLAMLVSQKP